MTGTKLPEVSTDYCCANLNLMDSLVRPETVGKSIAELPSNNVWKDTVYRA